MPPLRFHISSTAIAPMSNARALILTDVALMNSKKNYLRRYRIIGAYAGFPFRCLFNS